LPGVRVAVITAAVDPADRDLDRSGPRGDRDNRRGRQAFDRDRGHDHGKGDRHRHRVFRNGVWVWVYGPEYYAYGNDYFWLRQPSLREAMEAL
jgi:hypothetical protein